MKTTIITLAFAAILVGCTGKKTDEHGHDHTDGTHMHEDGAMHTDTVAPTQEEFTIESDTAIKPEGQGHTHGDGSDHNH